MKRVLGAAGVLIVLTGMLLRTPAQDKKATDYKNELPRIPPRTPQEEQKSFRLPPGFHIELVAAEPHVQSPVAIDFDEHGRLYVAEFHEYNQYANKDYKGKGFVRLLEDTDGDGHYDKSTIFVDNIDAPVALACWDGGVFVGSVPDLLYCKDTDGDGKADVRRKVLTGFARDAAGEGMLNSFRWGLDNRFHIQTNISGGTVKHAEKKDAKVVSVKGQNILFDPRSETFDLTSGGGQHGMSMDDWGTTFVCSNSDPMSVLMYDGRYLRRNPYLQAPAAAVPLMPEGGKTRIHRISKVEPWRALRTRLRTNKLVPGSDEGGSPAGFFTGATGVTAYRGDAWPAELKGQLFTGEVSGNLVFRARVSPRGVGWVGERVDADVEFLASEDNWFRPVQFANGPDGNLYVIDMYRELIEGAAFLPPVILKHMDVSSGIDKGRIWRITKDGGKDGSRRSEDGGKSRLRLPPSVLRLPSSTTQLVALLEHPNGWHRDTASRLLFQRQDRKALEPLRKLASQSKSPLGRLHALYALQGLGALQAEEVVTALGDKEPRFREHALKLAESFASSPVVREEVLKMSQDADVRVRYQLAFTLGEFPGQQTTAALAQLAHQHANDSWFRLAILSSSHASAGDLLVRLLDDAELRGSPGGRTLLATLVAQIGAANRKADLARLIQGIEKLPEKDKSLKEDLVRSLASKQPVAARELLQGTKAGAILTKLVDAARTTAGDDKASVADRVEAIRTMGLLKFVDVQPIFAKLLKLNQPQPIQAAVLETVGRFTDPDVAGFIVEAWSQLSPKLRATATEAVFSRPEWIKTFLAAIEQKKVNSGELDPARVALLQAHPDTQIKALAARVFAGSKLARRPQVVEAYRKSLEMAGDVSRGKEVFKKNCATCHRLEGIGTSLGADLNAIRNRGKEAILLNILDPNREVLPQFVSYVVVLNSGRSLTGMISAETATSITLNRADGTHEVLLRIDIDDLRSTGLSFMPEGLEKEIDVRAMSDLIAYLDSIK